MARRRRTRANGEGTVYRRTDRPGRWVAALTTWDGERAIRRTRSASSKAAATELLREMRRARDTGRPLPDDRLTVALWLVRWLEQARPKVRPSTFELYERVVRRQLIPELGAIPLRRLQPSRVEAMLADLATAGLGPYSQRQARDVLARAIADAERDGIVDRNVAHLSRPPRTPIRRESAPTSADVRALVDALASHRLCDMVTLMAATGLRVSEAMGLRWEDVDLAEWPIAAGPSPSLTVRYQLARVNGEPILAPPKSERSRRTIILAPVAAAALARQQDLQARERFGARRIGRGWDSDLVFTTREGRPLAESTVQWVMARACERAGIRHIAPHDLRRFAATIIAATGDAKAAQTVLGHTAASMTLDVYASATDEGRRRAADAMQEALGNG